MNFTWTVGSPGRRTVEGVAKDAKGLESVKVWGVGILR